MNLQPYQQRVFDEYKDLMAKKDKLVDFIITPVFAALPVIERHLLDRQLMAMSEYRDVLVLRLSLWGITV